MLGLASLWGLALSSPALGASRRQEKIGIFDLDAIHAAPLEPETVARSVKDGIVTEAVRITSQPGVRPLIVLTYGVGVKGRPGLVIARRFGAEARVADAKMGFVGVSIAPPSGNGDPNKMDAVGGPQFDQQLGPRQYFTPNPHDSLLYHQVVALTRAVDYLATRPEVDLKQTAILGTEWPGVAVGLLHAIDNRPGAYFVWHGLGFYVDGEGKSGDMASKFTRQAYEMYSPAAYAGYGTQPIYFAGGLNGEMCPLDALMEWGRKLKSPHVFALSPNREITQTAKREFDGSSAWQRFYTKGTGIAPEIQEGNLEVADGKLRYACVAKGTTAVNALVSYGAEGNWFGRTWSRIPMKLTDGKYTADIPVYRRDLPVYVLAQGDTNGFGTIGNTPKAVSPTEVGVTTESEFPHTLLSFRPADDLYISTGSALYGVAGPDAATPAARILPRWDGMVRLRNVQPILWKDAKEVSFWLQGNGTPGPLNVYFGVESRDSIDTDTQNFTMLPLLKDGEVLGTTWRKFTISLDQVYDRDRVDSLFFATGGKPLVIAGLSWR